MPMKKEVRTLAVGTITITSLVSSQPTSTMDVCGLHWARKLTVSVECQEGTPYNITTPFTTY